jgi:hypothetical protein
MNLKQSGEIRRKWREGKWELLMERVNAPVDDPGQKPVNFRKDPETS